MELVSRTCYDQASKVTLEVDPLGHATTYAYDSAQRLEHVTDPQGNETTYYRDPGRNQPRKVEEKQVLPAGGNVAVETTFTYDGLGRQKTVTNGLGQTTTYHYDVRGNLEQVIDAAGNVISRHYDGLDRLTEEVRPEGIAVSYGYDASSRQTSYQDALGNTTTWAYDVLDRQTSVTYPDTTGESYQHDPNGNVLQITQPTGTVVTQSFDPANRMISRSIVLAAGVEGPTAETYTYDALGRLLSAVSGGVATTRTYDSLSRLLEEVNLGRTVSFAYDSADAVTRINYPSTLPVQLERSGDPLNRVQSISWGLATPVTIASYGYRGAGLVASATLGPLTSTVQYEPGTNRRSGALFNKAGGARVFEEEARWKPNDLKKAVARGDLNDRSVGFTYDGANRLKVAEYVQDVDSSVPISRALATIPDRFSFTYDAAQNLKSKTAAQVCESDTVTLPLDGSGRNRPGSVGGVGLTWDADGNLKTKGDLTFYYDYKNRLTRVVGAAGAIATYTYDAFNRRVRREVGGQTYETVWDDWQPIEEWQSSDQITYELNSRRTYGLGLDEIVALEIDYDGDGTLTQYTPIYDHAGNLAMVTDTAGKIVERYEYSPYGDQWILVDSTPPTLEQVRSVGGEIWVEFSEEVQRDLIESGVASGKFYMKNLTSGATVNVELTWPVKSGRQANRRLVVRGTDPPETTDWPAADESFELYIDASIVSDTFNNVATQTYQQTFVWSSSDVVFEDLANPRLERICVFSGAILELEFSEALSTAYTTARIQVNGQPLTWTVGGDGYTLRSSAPLAEGAYTLTIDVGELDLNGRGLVGAPYTSASFSVVSGAPETEVFNAPYAGLVASSTIGNPFGFHGISGDSETGLLYFRNRYYDPDLGRFITANPMGYGDGPSMYQFAAHSPFNYDDPLGLRALEESDKRIIRHLKKKQIELIEEYAASGTYKGKPIDQIQYEIELEILNKARARYILAVAEADPGQPISEGYTTHDRAFSRVYHIPLFWPTPTPEEVERTQRRVRWVFFVTADVPMLLSPVAAARAPAPTRTVAARRRGVGHRGALSGPRTAREARWATSRQGEAGPGLRDHFAKHGAAVGARTPSEYDASARRTIAAGRRFRYRDRVTGETRVGYWDAETGFFTGTSQTGRVPIIRTHYPERWDQLKELPGFSSTDR